MPGRLGSVAAALWLAGVVAAPACTTAPHLATHMPESVSQPWPSNSAPNDRLIAWFDGPTTRYAHGVLGDAVEGTRLHVYSENSASPCGDHTITLSDDLVFEDIAPRLADLDSDGAPEIIVVQSHQHLGAQLAIYRATPNAPGIELITATPFIGRSNRWLAPIGAADLDGDGHIEIAYIDRPHLARTLRIWRYQNGQLTQIAALDGLTNHRIGEDFITGGIVDCGAGPEIITANATWSRLIATRLTATSLTPRDLGRFSRSAARAALACAR